MDNKDIMQELSKKIGANPKELEESAKSGNMESILNKLNPSQREKVESLLADPDRTRKIMESPQVQALIRKLQGNG